MAGYEKLWYESKVAKRADLGMFERSGRGLNCLLASVSAFYSSVMSVRAKIGTSNTNCYLKYQLLLPLPIVTSNTNCYFGCHE
jgi:hypothetical protein